MANREWLERVRRRLARAGLPAEYVGRLLVELRDHAEELGAEGQLLGEPDSVAAAAVSTFRDGSFAGRHPVLAFVWSPLAGLLLAWALYTVVADVALCGLLAVGGPVTPGFADAVARLPGLGLPLLLVALLWRCYRRSGRPLGWFHGGCCVLALSASLLAGEIEPRPEMFPGVVVEVRPWCLWLQAAQFLIPLGFGLYVAPPPGRIHAAA